MRKTSQLIQLILLLLTAVVVVFVLSYGEKKSNLQPQISSKKNTSIKLPKAEIKLKTYKKQKTEAGLTLLPISGTEEILLINNEGEIQHRWDGIDAARARLLPECKLLVIHGSKWGLKVERWKGRKHFLSVYEKNGEVSWEYKGDEFIHHDAHRLENGNYFFLEVRTLPLPHNIRHRSKTAHTHVRSDTVREVTPQGEIVFSWNADDHLDMENCSWNGCEDKRKVRNEHIWDWTHINTASIIPPNKWYDAGDTRFKPGNFFIIPRAFWTTYIIEKDTGKIVWEYIGKNEGGVVRGHEAHIIPKEFPGAGNVLLFDNGLDRVRSYSRVLEINPVTMKTVWKYEDQKRFFSRGGGSIQRLKNGNTLISEDIRGRVFEVTPELEIVWEIKTKFRISRAHRYPSKLCSAE